MLLEAVLRGRIYQVKFLLDNNVENVNKTDENGQTCLMKAIFLGDKLSRTRSKLVKLLLRNGTKVNIVDKNQKTALMWASLLGKDELVGIILREAIVDLDLNVVDLDGNSALHLAATKGYINIVKMLVKALKRFGLDIDRKNFRGMTPMLAAVEQGHGLCVEVLMTEGEASLTVRDSCNFLNTREWAERRSLTSLSQLIARRSPTPVTPTPDISSKFPSNSDERVKLSLNANPDILSVEQKVEERTSSRADNAFKAGQQKERDASQNKRNVVNRTSEPSRETSSQLWKRKATSNSFCATQSSAASICSLFSLYGAHHSETFRKGFDLASLPPSGFYPEVPQEETEPDEFLDCNNTLLYGSESRTNSTLRRKISSLTSAFSPDSPGSSRRNSNAGLTREGRKISTLNVFSGVGASERRRRATVAQPPPNRASLIAEFTRKSSVSSYNPKERRISVAGMGGENRRPVLGDGLNPAPLKMRQTTNTVPRLAFDSFQE